MDNETKKLWKKAFMAFSVIALSILFFFFVYRFDIVCKTVSTIVSVLQPVIFGLVIAYLLSPLVDILNDKVFPKLFKKKNGEFKLSAGLSILSVCISLLAFIIIIAGIIVLIIPGLIDSFSKAIDVLPTQIDNLMKWGNRFLKENKSIESAFQKVLSYEKKWLKNDFAEYINTAAEYFASGIFSILIFLKNFAIGFMIAIYLLYNKTRFGNKTRKFMFALFKEDSVKNILLGLHKSNAVFSGFIYGKLLDSLIIGILCFVGVTVMKIPYTMLVAVIIGVTNIIPIFGPYIGAIPCSLLILVTDPLKGLYFIIFVILLQTLDGNVIGPKILGDKTGLDTFWVIFAIIVGGGLFGIIGLIIGVPLFAVIYYFASMAVNNKLRKKSLSTNSDDYSTEKIIDEQNAEGDETNA